MGRFIAGALVMLIVAIGIVAAVAFFLWPQWTGMS